VNSSGKYFGRERRRYPRIPFGYLIKYRIAKEKRNRYCKSTSKNLSLGGILIETKKKLPLNSSIEMDLLLPTEEEPTRITVTGIVKRVIPIQKGKLHDVAIEFTKIPAEHKVSLLKFINAVLINI